MRHWSGINTTPRSWMFIPIAVLNELGLWKWIIFYYSENDVDCDRSCLTSAEGRRKRSLEFGTSFSLMADDRSRAKRAVTRSLFPSDRGPIEFLDATGNLIQLERELQKPRKYNRGSHHHKDLKKQNKTKTDDTFSIQNAIIIGMDLLAGPILTNSSSKIGACVELMLIICLIYHLLR